MGISSALVDWYRQEKRDLPWRRTRDPYAIWVSEIMLQQTRVAAVVPYWERWMARFPSAEALAAAELDEVLAAWSGLGYYGRARNLHRGAREVVARHGGTLPCSAAELRALPGVGRYTAGAIASMAFDLPEPLVDGNVARVLARLFAIETDVKASATQRRLWQLAAQLVPASAPGDFNQGLMELGAVVCVPGQPRCERCPLAASCQARAAGRQGELPVVARRRPDADKPLLQATAGWMIRRGRLLLARRRPEGLFGGLWELPQAASRSALSRLLSEVNLVAALEGEPPVHVHRQVLSHRRLEIEVVAGAARGTLAPLAPAGPYERFAWHPLAGLAELGLAAASRAILARYQENKGWTRPSEPSRSSRRGTRRSSRA
jgi:A/G-specific adenine glycosylase